ncbi:unnamed protein product, partial [Vitis vinifera]|uniref:Uncharacterized protein n=1 Tax=Vitis vinifera TaxID=29760 RepID=D7TXW9_VITVI
MARNGETGIKDGCQTELIPQSYKCIFKRLIMTDDEMRDHIFQLLGNDFFPNGKKGIKNKRKDTGISRLHQNKILKGKEHGYVLHELTHSWQGTKLFSQTQSSKPRSRDGTQLLNGSNNELVGNDALVRQNPANANTLVTKMYEEILKLPLQRDPLDDASMKRFGESVNQPLDSDHASLLKSAAVDG